MHHQNVIPTPRLQRKVNSKPSDHFTEVLDKKDRPRTRRERKKNPAFAQSSLHLGLTIQGFALTVFANIEHQETHKQSWVDGVVFFGFGN